MQIKDELDDLIDDFKGVIKKDGKIIEYVPVTLSSFRQEQLETKFIDIIEKELTKNGKDEINIEMCARKASLLFHPDIISNNKAASWIERSLGNYAENEPLTKAICFKLLLECKETLIKNLTADLKADLEQKYTVEACRNFCMQKINKVTSPTQLHFYESCITLLDNIIEYNKKVDASQRVSIVACSQKFIPSAITASIGAFFAKELFIYYGICGMCNFVGHTIKDMKNPRYKFFGAALESCSTDAAMKITTSFLTVHTVITSLCNKNHDKIMNEFDYVQDVLKTLLPKSEKKAIRSLVDYEFRTEALKTITEPLKNYLVQNDRQCCKPLRVGQKKSDAVKDFLFTLIKMEEENRVDLAEVWELLRDLNEKRAVQKNKGTIQKAIVECAEKMRAMAPITNGCTA